MHEKFPQYSRDCVLAVGQLAGAGISNSSKAAQSEKAQGSEAPSISLDQLRDAAHRECGTVLLGHEFGTRDAWTELHHESSPRLRNSCRLQR